MKFFKNLSILLNRILPVKKKTVLFSSFNGMFNDNPKAIFNEFVKEHKDYEIIWVKDYKNKEQVPDFVKTVEMGSKEYYKYVFRAQIVIDNHLGLRSFCCDKRKRLKGAVYGFLSARKKRQLNISTWHGTALKRIGVECNEKYYCCSDLLFFGDEIIASQIRKYYAINKKTVICGCPRNDVFEKITESDIEKIKNKLCIPLDRKVILYAPTFRSKEQNYGINVFEELDSERIIRSFEEKFGGKWCIVQRVHHIVLGYLLKNGVSVFSKNVIDGNIGEDMTDYLCCSDFLITDYSSSLFDCIAVDKACTLFVPDLDYYENVERGFVFDFEKLPLSKAENMDELEKNIKDFNEDGYRTAINGFAKEYGFVKNVNSSKEIMKYIDSFIKTGRKSF